MSLTQEQIKKIAENLTKIPVEKHKNWENINNILKYLELLDEVDTEGVEPTFSVSKKENILREDVEVEKEVLPKELLNCSPQSVVADQIAISNIMK